MLESEITNKRNILANAQLKLADLNTFLTVLKTKEASEQNEKVKNSMRTTINYYESEKLKVQHTIESTQREILNLLDSNKSTLKR